MPFFQFLSIGIYASLFYTAGKKVNNHKRNQFDSSIISDPCECHPNSVVQRESFALCIDILAESCQCTQESCKVFHVIDSIKKLSDHYFVVVNSVRNHLLVMECIVQLTQILMDSLIKPLTLYVIMN